MTATSSGKMLRFYWVTFRLEPNKLKSQATIWDSPVAVLRRMTVAKKPNMSLKIAQLTFLQEKASTAMRTEEICATKIGQIIKAKLAALPNLFLREEHRSVSKSSLSSIPQSPQKCLSLWFLFCMKDCHAQSTFSSKERFLSKKKLLKLKLRFQTKK